MTKNNTIALLLKSKNLSAQLLGAAALCIWFMPTLAQTMDDPTLTVWGRIGALSTAAGETLLAVGVAGLRPEWFIDENDKRDDQPV